MEFDELDLGPDGSNLGISIDEHIGDNIGDDEVSKGRSLDPVRNPTAQSSLCI